MEDIFKLIILFVIIVMAVYIAKYWSREYIGRGQHKQIESKSDEKMELIKLEEADHEHIKQFAEMMARPENTRALGTGEAWTQDKIEAFVKHAREDAAAGNTQYSHWIICANGAVVGYVSLRPYTGKQLQFRYVIDPAHRGRGYAKWAVQSLARKGHWFVVDPTNAASINVALAAGARQAGNKFIGNKKYNLYRVN